MSDANISWCPPCKAVYNASLAGGVSPSNNKREPSLFVGRIIFILFGGGASIAAAFLMGYDSRIGIRAFIEQAGTLRSLLALLAGIVAGGAAVSFYTAMVRGAGKPEGNDGGYLLSKEQRDELSRRPDDFRRKNENQ
jgi:hypothetical protein